MMFNFETAITDWRRQMLAAGAGSPALIEELESHLREEIEQQMKSGASAQAAFEFSILQIGRAEALNVEFKKISNVRETFERWTARFAIYGSTAAYCFVLAMGANILVSVDMDLGNRLIGLAAVASSIIAIFGGRFLKQLFPVIPGRRARQKVQFACLLPAIIWFLVYAKVILPNLDYDHFNLQLVFVMTLWTITLLPISFRLWKGFDDAALEQFSEAS